MAGLVGCGDGSTENSDPAPTPTKTRTAPSQPSGITTTNTLRSYLHRRSYLLEEFGMQLAGQVLLHVWGSRGSRGLVFRGV